MGGLWLQCFHCKEIGSHSISNVISMKEPKVAVCSKCNDKKIECGKCEREYKLSLSTLCITCNGPLCPRCDGWNKCPCTKGTNRSVCYKCLVGCNQCHEEGANGPLCNHMVDSAVLCINCEKQCEE